MAENWPCGAAAWERSQNAEELDSFRVEVIVAEVTLTQTTEKKRNGDRKRKRTWEEFRERWTVIDTKDEGRSFQFIAGVASSFRCWAERRYLVMALFPSWC